MTLLKRHALTSGIVLMFLLTWPIDLANSGVLPFQVPFAVYIVLGWGFVIASVIMTWLTLGKDDVVRLLKRFLIWRVGAKWFLIAFLLFPIIQLSGVIVSAAISGAPIDFSIVFAHRIFGPSASLPLFVVPYLLFDAITNGEEIGWRGYVLPRLQARYSALVSSLILVVVWALCTCPSSWRLGIRASWGGSC